MYQLKLQLRNSSPLAYHKHEIPLQPTLPEALLNLQMKYNTPTNSKSVPWLDNKEIFFYNSQKQMLILLSPHATYRKP